MSTDQIRKWDFQADAFEGRYRLVEDLGGGRWTIETLAPDDAEIERIVAHYETAEANGWSTCPIWSKTWGECVGDERPEIVGYKSHADEMVEEIERREADAGRRSEIQFVSPARYAAAF